LADGRVFTGRHAHKIGLIDRLGNLDDAVQAAAFIGKIQGKVQVLRESEPALRLQLQEPNGKLKKNILSWVRGQDFGTHLDKTMDSNP
jgi:ClpP class serine protease